MLAMRKALAKNNYSVSGCFDVTCSVGHIPPSVQEVVWENVELPDDQCLRPEDEADRLGHFVHLDHDFLAMVPQVPGQQALTLHRAAVLLVVARGHSLLVNMLFTFTEAEKVK